MTRLCYTSKDLLKSGTRLKSHFKITQICLALLLASNSLQFMRWFAQEILDMVFHLDLWSLWLIILTTVMWTWFVKWSTSECIWKLIRPVLILTNLGFKIITWVHSLQKSCYREKKLFRELSSLSKSTFLKYKKKVNIEIYGR